ncbi:hypothetical protein Sjap_014263 [Stephania japonica]|uniref:PLAC8 family protein n=1 Tax=Stephania japonica TaxID=461633 RepID=A0AAP0P236_9MAGN
MVSSDNGQCSESVQDGLGSGLTATNSKIKGQIPLNISVSQRGLLGHDKRQKGFLGRIMNFHKKIGFLNNASSSYSLSSPSAKFRRIAEEKDEISRSVPSTSEGLQERFRVSFVREINLDSLWQSFKDWIRDPLNMALFVWILCVAISGALLFMVMTGMLNHAIRRKSERDTWFEVNNQILNALFTLMCLYQHPKRFYHLVLLCQWKQDDISRLRKIYCRGGTYKPHEWAHMMVVVALLHLNCFAQYALCGLNLGYRRSDRPPIGVGICISVAIASPAIAGLYTILSPLGKDYETEVDLEAQDHATVARVEGSSPLRRMSFEKRLSFALRDNQKLLESRPEWRGGLFDFWDDISVAYLSLFCSCCVFGWNMERLGFGNMYVHIVTFLLFCMAPFWIFNLAALNIDNEMVRGALSVTGIVLCVFGLLYGGFWRIQMRKRFNLPANNFCCGKPGLTDCAQWLCCCWCSLAQEVRTVDYYDIVEDKFYRKQNNENDQPDLPPLRREDRSVLSRSGHSSPHWEKPSASDLGMINHLSPSRFSTGSASPIRHLPPVEEETPRRGKDSIMTPPVPSVIQRDDDAINSV